MSILTLIVGIVQLAVWLFGLAIVARILLSWLPLRSGRLSYRTYGVLCVVTEPYLRLFRRIGPPVRLANVALDLSPVVGLVVLIIGLAWGELVRTLL